MKANYSVGICKVDKHFDDKTIALVDNSVIDTHYHIIFCFYANVPLLRKFLGQYFVKHCVALATTASTHS